MIFHGRMIPFPIPVGLHCSNQVLVILATDLGYLVCRVDIVIAGDAMATRAGIGLHLPAFSITGRMGGSVPTEADILQAIAELNS